MSFTSKVLLQNATGPVVSDVLVVPQGHAVTIAVQASGVVDARVEGTVTDPSDATADVWVTVRTTTTTNVFTLPPGFQGVRVTLASGTVASVQASAFQAPALLVQ